MTIVIKFVNLRRRAERSPSPAHEYRSPARRSAFGYSSLLSHSSTPRIRSPSPARSVSRSPHQQDRHKCHSIGPEWGPLGSSAYQSRSSTSRSPSPHMRASGSLGRQGRQGSLSYGPEWNPSPYRCPFPSSTPNPGACVLLRGFSADPLNSAD